MKALAHRVQKAASFAALLIVFVAAIAAPLSAQTSDTSARINAVDLLYRENSSHLLFVPLIANPFEPRIGTMYQVDDNKLRLDIGTSFDLLRIRDAYVEKIVVGGDFFTFTRLRSEGKLKFPVETVDYFFGLNASGKWNLDDGFLYSARVRVSHISAHLADGVADTSGTLHPKNFVYSREFIDAVGAIEHKQLRAYLGATLIFSNKKLQRDVALFIPQIGAEYSINIGCGLTANAGYDLKLSGIDDKRSLVHAVQAGIVIPQANNYRLSLNAYYYHGLSLHGLFYDTVDDYLGFGFQVLL